MKGETDKSTITVGNVNTSVSLVGGTTGQKIRKDMEELRIFYMYKELTYILRIIVGLLETFVNFQLLSECHFDFPNLTDLL